MAHWFAGFTGMETFEFPYLDVSRVTDFSHMLDGCSSLKTLNITNFTTLPNETRQQTPAMTSMFDGCVALTQVMVGDTFAFAEDGLLPAPDGEHVSGADGKWYAMSTGEGYDPKDIPSYKAETYRADHGDFQAFAVYSAASDGEPAILNFYKRPVVPAEGTVFDGRVATKVFTGFENRTYSVADDLWESYKNSYIYSSVTKATVVDYGIAPLNLSHWFHKFWSLESVDVSKLDVSRAKEMVEMFHECGNLTSIDLSTFQTSSVTDMESMFASCYKLKSVSFPESFDTSNVTNMSRLFVNCYDLESLDLSHFNTKKVTASQDTFTNITCLATVKIGPEFKWLENGVGASFLPTPASGKWHAKWGRTGYLPKDVPIPTTGTATYTQNPPAQVAAQDANNPAVASDPSASTASVPQGTQAAAASPNKSAAGSSQSAEGAALSGTQGNDASSMPAARKEQAVVEGSASEEGAPSADTQSAAAGGKPVNDHAE